MHTLSSNSKDEFNFVYLEFHLLVDPTTSDHNRVAATSSSNLPITFSPISLYKASLLSSQGTMDGYQAEWKG